MTTSTQTQLRRGTSAQVAAMTPAEGEAVVNTTTKGIHVGDGLTAGGVPLAPLASPALTGTPTAPTAAGGTSTTQLATTAFVQAALSGFSPPSSFPAAVTASLTTGSSVAVVVDFSTYSAYDVLIQGLTTTLAGDLRFDVSTNGGVSYGLVSNRFRAYIPSGGSMVSAAGTEAPMDGSATFLTGTLTQGSATGTAVLSYTSGHLTGTLQFGSVFFNSSAAINRVQLALVSSSFTAGALILQPKSKR